MRRALAAAVAASLALALPEPAARAYDVEVNSETIGQGYQIIAGDRSIIQRARLDQYLGLNIFNLGPKDATGAPMARNQWYFASSMRLQFDFGDYPPGNNNLGGRDTFQEIPNNRFELLYAYFGGRDLGGFLDLKVGRQIDYDNFSFISYDGLNLLAKTPFYLAAELYAGLLVNGYLPVDSPIFRPDGTSQGTLSIHDRDAKPVIGVGLRSFGFRDLDFRLSFREILSPGTGSDCNGNTGDPQYYAIGNLERCFKVKDGTTEQSLSLTARARLADGVVIPWAGVRYDLLTMMLDTIQAGLRLTIKRDHAITLEYLYSYPTFDGDSIFNLFTHREFNDLRAGYDVRAGRFRLYGRGFARFFNDVSESTDRAGSTVAPVGPGNNLDAGGNLGLRYDLGAGFVRADGYLEYGYGGHKVGGDLSTRFKVYREVLALEGRVTLVDFNDDFRPINHATSFGFQVGGRAQLARGVLLHVILEDNINRFYSSQLRLYGVLDVTGLFGSGGPAMSPPRGVGPAMGQYGSGYGLGMGY